MCVYQTISSKEPREGERRLPSTRLIDPFPHGRRFSCPVSLPPLLNKAQVTPSISNAVSRDCFALVSLLL